MIKFSKNITIDERNIGRGNPVYIIAEAGVAHFGNEEKAYRLVDLAVEADADAIKFQIFDVNALISNELKDWKERLRSRQLPFQAFERIQRYCRGKDITFFATAHDEPSLEFLQSLNVPAYKVGSGEVGNWPYLSRVAALGKPIIFSTGMYRISQIKEALETVAATGNTDVAVLHCVTRYPTSPEEVSLGNIELIRERFNVICGYSDHTMGYHIPLAAAALGASIIEKHISFDFDVPDAQDWKVSCGPHNFGLFIKQTRQIEAALGVRKSGPTEGERESLVWARKSLVAKHNISVGSLLSRDDILSKRAGMGIPPSQIGQVLGRKTKVPLLKDDVIKFEDLE